MWLTERRIAGVPVLLAAADGDRAALPIVFWYHGFGVDKETHRKELERLADAGFLAVGVDSAGHGRRRLPDLDARQAAPRDEALRTVVELASATAAELPALVRALAGEGLGDARRLGVAGISMGAYIVYQAVVVEPAVRAAVAILGSPSWPTGDSPHLHLDVLERTALLSITAECDVNVPPDDARLLHRALAARRPGSARHRYVEIAGADHFLREGAWDVVMAETIAWFGEKLATSD